MVFSGLYPIDGSDYPDLRDALDKLKLNDAALVYEPETSVALGFGFRCGFLGLLHLEIVPERLEREFDLDLIATAADVEYEVTLEDGSTSTSPTRASSPTARSRGPRAGRPRRDPRPQGLHRHDHGALPAPPGHLLGMDYLGGDRVEIRYNMPLGEIVFDFFDQLKSRTRGLRLARLRARRRAGPDLVKVDILLQGEQVDAFSSIVHRDKAYGYGVLMASKLRELIPRQQFEVPIQAAIGVAHHRPRDDPGDAQGRPRQVLRR